MTDFLGMFGNYDFAVRQALILMLLGLSVYVLLRAGMFAVPQIGFMAIGSYTSALLSLKQGWPFPLALASAALAGGLAGLLLGALLARLSGIYLAIATIGFSEIVRDSIINVNVTGGPQGLFGIPRAANDLYIVGVLLVATILLARLQTSRFGLAIAAVREEPLMTSHQGVDVRFTRLVLFGLSGGLAGLAGSLFVHQSGFVEPAAYSFGLLVQILASVVLGGMLSVFGPILGGIVIFGLPQVLGAFGEYRNVVDGLLIVLVVALLPSGMVGLFDAAYRFLSLRMVGVRKRHTPHDGVPAPSVESSAGPVPGAVAYERPAMGTTIEQARLLELVDIKKRFGGIHALNGVSIDVAAGEVLGVIGPNGSGKTSLLNVLSGVYRPDSGNGVLAGNPLAPLWGKPHELAEVGIARTFQGIRLLGDYSVADNVLLGAHHAQSAGPVRALLGTAAARREANAARERVMQTLDELDLRRMAHTAAGSLPYGLQRKVEIARAVVSGPRLLLLDEPTAGMTPAERDEVFDLVQAVRGRGVTVVVVEHDVAVMMSHCDRLTVLNFGMTIASGTPESVIQDREVIDAYIGRPVAST